MSSEVSVVARARESFKLHEEGKKLQKMVGLSHLAKGKKLSEIKRGGHWKDVLGFEGTWKDYCRQPEFPACSDSYADQLIRLYEVFVKQLGYKEEQLADIDRKRLLMVIPLVGGERDWVEDARHNDRKALQKLIDEHESGVSPMTCGHPEVEEITYKRCKVCRDTWK